MVDEQDEFIPVGVSGLTRYSGYVQEEFLRELQGPRWFRAIRQMVDNDAVIGGILFAIEMLVRQVKWQVQPADESAEAIADADFIEECRTDMAVSWQDTISEILSFIWWGYSILEIVYKQRRGDEPGTYNGRDGRPRQLPKSQYDDNRIGWNRWGIRAQETFSRWEFDDETGDAIAFVQRAAPDYVERVIPISKCLHFRASSRKGNPEGRSVLRTAYRAWYFRNNIERIEGVGIERDLAGLPCVKVPSKIIAAGGQVYTDWKNLVVNIRRDEQEGLVMPSDRDANHNPLYEVELLSTGGTRQFDTNKTILRFNADITRSVLADFLMIGHEATGSYALSNDKTTMFHLAINGYCDVIADVINEKAIPDLLRLNGRKADKTPMLRPAEVKNVDLGILGKFISDLASSGMTIFPTADGKLESTLIDTAGLPAPEPETFVAQAEEAKADKEAQAQLLAKATAAKPNGHATVPEEDAA